MVLVSLLFLLVAVGAQSPAPTSRPDGSFCVEVPPTSYVRTPPLEEWNFVGVAFLVLFGAVVVAWLYSLVQFVLISRRYRTVSEDEDGISYLLMQNNS